MGVVVGGAVYHAILDLPKSGRRAALAAELAERLTMIPGVARAAINPVGRTLTVEYIVTAVEALANIAEQLRALGYRVRDLRRMDSYECEVAPAEVETNRARDVTG